MPAWLPTDDSDSMVKPPIPAAAARTPPSSLPSPSSSSSRSLRRSHRSAALAAYRSLFASISAAFSANLERIVFFLLNFPPFLPMVEGEERSRKEKEVSPPPSSWWRMEKAQKFTTASNSVMPLDPGY